MSPGTLGDWVRQYRDEVEELVAKKRMDEEQLKRDAERVSIRVLFRKIRLSEDSKADEACDR